MKKYLITTVLLIATSFAFAQTMMPLPAFARIYTGNVRGYWFTATSDFIITGLRVPSDAGTGTQYIQLVRFGAGPPPAYSASTTNFTTLASIQGTAAGVINSVNIPVTTGDVIGVLGQTSNNGNAYANPAGPYVSTINGASVTLTRMLYQGTLSSSLAGPISQEATGQIARVELYWTPPYSSPNDAGVSALIEPNSTCEGAYDIKVEVENTGTAQLDSLEVRWSWNGLSQPTYYYNSTLDTANGTGQSKDTITLGTKTLMGGNTYDLLAWTKNPNGMPDTVNYNDTLSELLIGLRYPKVDLGVDTTICPNEPIDLDAGIGRDSIIWNFTSSRDSVVSVGAAGQYIANVFELGCETRDTINISLFPQPADVDFGQDTIICDGTSLLLDASTPGMTYQWQNSSTSPTQTVTAAGKYWVILEDANTCNSGDTINVDLFDDPSVILTVSPSNNLCYGVPFTFRAFPKTDGSIAYQWRVNGAAIGSVTTDGTFQGPADFGDTVTVDLITDICSTTVYPVPSNEIIMSINPAPKGISGKNLVIENTTGVYAVANVATSNFVWRIKGGTITSDSTKNFVNVKWGAPNPNAELICEESDSKNCVRENVQPITVVSIVGVRPNEQSIGLGNAYPNPANNSVTIPLKGIGLWDVDINLYDITGKHILAIYSGMVDGSKNITFPVRELNNGLYFYRVTTADGFEAVKKITVNH